VLRALAVTSGLAVLAAGCSVSKVSYHLANPLVKKEGKVAVAVAVQDQRASVIAGGRPDLVGLMRAGFGNASDVTTGSGEPLAADFSSCVRRGLQESSYQVAPVKVMIRSRQEYVIAQMAKTGAQRLLLVSIDAWESDSRSNKWSVSNTWLVYDVTVQVFDPQGHLLGRARTFGRDNVGSYDPPETALPELYQLKLELLLNDRSIARALNVAPADSSAPSSSPAVTPAPTSE
jgi:hypothetical protein